MRGVVPAEGAYALALEERPDVAADLVDVVGLVAGDDVQEHGFEADDRGGQWWWLSSSFLLHNDNVIVAVVVVDIVIIPAAIYQQRVTQNRCSEVGHVLHRHPTARLQERVLVLDGAELPFADAEVPVHEFVVVAVGVIGHDAAAGCGFVIIIIENNRNGNFTKGRGQ